MLIRCRRLQWSAPDLSHAARCWLDRRHRYASRASGARRRISLCQSGSTPLDVNRGSAMPRAMNCAFLSTLRRGPNLTEPQPTRCLKNPPILHRQTADSTLSSSSPYTFHWHRSVRILRRLVLTRLPHSWQRRVTSTRNAPAAYDPRIDRNIASNVSPRFDRRR